MYAHMSMEMEHINFSNVQFVVVANMDFAYLCTYVHGTITISTYVHVYVYTNVLYVYVPHQFQ